MRHLKLTILPLLFSLDGCTPPPNNSTSNATSKPTRSAKQLEVLTHNIHGAHADVRQLSVFLKASPVDVLCLQEIQRKNGTSDQAVDLAKTLGYPYVASPSTMNIPDNQDCDVAILSQFPLTEMKAHALQAGGRVYAVSAKVDSLDEHPLVFSVHLHATFLPSLKHVIESSTARAEEVTALLGIVRTANSPCIVAGDFNTDPAMPDYKRMTSDWRDFGAVSTASVATFPSENPAMRLDYVFGNAACECISYSAIPNTISDHRPVRTSLRIHGKSD